MIQTTEPRITTCPKCGIPTTVYPFHIGGQGPVDHVICPKGMESQNDAHPGIIQRLPHTWTLEELAEREEQADRRLAISRQHAEWRAKVRWSLAYGAVLTVCLVAVWLAGR